MISLLYLFPCAPATLTAVCVCVCPCDPCGYKWISALMNLLLNDGINSTACRRLEVSKHRLSRAVGWWICLQGHVWPPWPVGCPASVGTHLGSAASASEAQDRWCQTGLRSPAKQASRNEQTLIYAAAAGVLVGSWPLLGRRSAIGVGAVVVMTNGWACSSLGTGLAFAPPVSCGVRAAYVQKAQPLKDTPG